MIKMTTHSRVGLAVLALASIPQFASAQLSVDPGWDLFQSMDTTTFNGANFMGVPIGSYNFGGTIGVKNTGNTDTIIQRQGTVNVAAPGDSQTIQIQMDVLQLETVAPVNFGAGLGNYFITLQSAAGGPASTGTMTVTVASAAGGTFTSSLDVFFNIEFGSLTGPVVMSGDLTLTNSGDTWTRIPIPGAETIPGVNINLNGANNAADFWPGVPLIEQHPTGAQHVVTDALTPEPPQLAVFAIPACLLLLRRRRSKKSA